MNESTIQRVKIYTDGADKASMLKAANDPLIKGLTTNPTLMKRAGVIDYVLFAREILSEIKHKPISFEVFSDDFNEMHRQATEINSWGKNVYVKIPVMNSEGQSSQELIKDLSHHGVKLNVTALLTLSQVIETCESLKGGAPSVVSVFGGRIADTGTDPIPFMKAAKEICIAAEGEIELLWASCREVLNIVQADQAGCNIITVQPELIDKFKKQEGKNLLRLSLETVQMFRNDAVSAGYTI